MTRQVPLSSSPRSAPARGPLSRGRVLESRLCPGRGRSVGAVRRAHGQVAGGRVTVAPAVDPVALRDWWSDLVQRRCGRREDAAAAFGAAFQTACTWFDGVGSPNAAHLMAALMMWPDEFGIG